MATIRKHIATTTMPKAVRRSNAFPLDASAVWHSYEDMAKYAATNPTAYVGQIVSLINGFGEAAAYIIKNVEGELIPVGTGVISDVGESSVDNLTIAINNSTLHLKNWGVQYYKWDKETETYTLTVVDDQHPWMLGLEPRVAQNNAGEPELAWYEPSTDLALQKTVEEIAQKVEERLPLSGGVLSGALTLQDGYEAASVQAVDTKIAAAIATAGTLKREIVQTLPPVEEADPDTIYMMPNGLTTSDNIYDEFMLINGKFELIGDTRVILDDYIEKVKYFTVGDIPEIDGNGALITSGVSGAAVRGHLIDDTIHITGADRQYWDSIKELAETTAEKLDNIPVLEWHEYDKLVALPPITGIGGGLGLDETGMLVIEEGALIPPVASEDTIGGVKSSTEPNSIYVDPETGIMSVNEISVNNLYVPADTELVLSAGDSDGYNELF